MGLLYNYDIVGTNTFEDKMDVQANVQLDFRTARKVLATSLLGELLFHLGYKWRIKPISKKEKKVDPHNIGKIALKKCHQTHDNEQWCAELDKGVILHWIVCPVPTKDDKHFYHYWVTHTETDESINYASQILDFIADKGYRWLPQSPF